MAPPEASLVRNIRRAFLHDTRRWFMYGVTRADEELILYRRQDTVWPMAGHRGEGARCDIKAVERKSPKQPLTKQ